MAAIVDIDLVVSGQGAPAAITLAMTEDKLSGFQAA